VTWSRTRRIDFITDVFSGNPPTPLVDFLKKLDSFLNVRQFGLIHHEPQEGDDPTNIVRTFGSREEM
jgi:hypothetical protein